MIIKNANHYFLQGGGEMGEMIRAKDWSKTSLGDPAGWPQSLCTIVAVMLDNPFAMYIAWGDDYTQIYNDGYRPILGATKHPQALGISTRETFAEIWTIIGPMFDGVMKGKAVGFPDFMLPLNRNGFVEECYFDFSYSPIRKDDGEIGGILVTVIETTNKKKTEDALKESEQRFRTMADNIPNLAWVADEEGWIYWYNKQWYEYTGTTPEQMEGWGWQSVHDPVELPQVLEKWKDSIATGHAFEMVFPIKGANGKFRHFLTRVLPVKDEEGKIIQWFGSNTDITPQKEIEEALKESEQRFRDTVKQAPVGITILRGKNYIVEMANDTYLQLIDRKVTEFVGRPLFDCLPEVEESVHALLDSVLDTGVPFHGNEVPIPINRYGKQEVFYFDFLYYPLKEKDGEISGIIVTVTEVTEKVTAAKKIKENENQLQSIFFNAPAAIAVITGPEHTYVLANNEYQKMVSRTSEQLVGKNSKAIFPELVGTGTFEIFDGIYKSGKSFSLAEYPVKLDKNYNGNMEQVYFRFSAVPLKDAEGKFNSIVIVAVDITEQVEARNQIQESEQRFGAAIAAVQGILWTNNGKGEMEGEQPGWASLTGQTYEEFQGYGWANAVHPDDAQPTLAAWKQAVKERKTFIFEHRVKTKDGQWRDFSIRAIPLLNTDGSLRQWVGVHTDITEQKLGEQKLAYRTALLEAHNEASVDGILLVDAKGKILSFNQRFIEIWNMPQHIVNANDDEAALSFAMTQLVSPQQFIDKVKYLYEHPTETSLDELEFKDGKIVERNGYPVLGEDSIYYAWSWTFKDITSQKNYEKTIIESEKRFRLLADSMPQHIWTSDPEGNLNYYNQSVLDYSGLTLEQINKGGWLQIVHPDDRDENIKEWINSITTGKDFLFDHRFRRHDGEYRWQLSRAIPQKDENGKIQMWVGTSTDIQEQKTFAKELEKQVHNRTKELADTNIELERKNKDLESFAYISSHDLQEPLRKIQTFATRIIEKEYDALSENGKDNFRRMQGAANRMQTLIQDLLIYSKTNTTERKFENTNLKNIIDEVKEDLSEELKDKNATIEATSLCDAKIIPFQFRQLLHNLIGNALKFSVPNTPPHIKIKSEIVIGKNLNNEKLNPQNKYCHIAISDNGIGFEQQYSEKIFEVFQRLHGKNQYNGTGIGLSIVKKIVENHEGIITAKSELNKGSTFDIYIPAT